MSIFDLILKRRPERKITDDPRPSVIVGRAGTSRTTVSKPAAMSAERALKHPVIFRCVIKIAQAVQTVPWIAEADPTVTSGEAVPEAQIKAVQDVLDYPTDEYTPEMMRFWMALNFALHMKVGFKVGMSALDLPNAIYPLMAGQLKTEYDNNARVTGYEYGDTQNKVRLSTRRAASPNRDLSKNPTKPYAFEICAPNLSGDSGNPYQLSPMQALSLPSDIVSMLMQRAHEMAAGTPNTKYIVTGEKQLTQKQEDAITDFIYNSAVGGEESGGILALFNGKIDVTKLDNDLADMHTKIPADDMARHIAGIFGVPISMLGLGGSDAGKFANNYQEGRRAFYEDTIIPGYLIPMQAGMTAGLCPRGVRLRYDVDAIPALREARTVRAKNLESVTFLTVDEKRDLSGFPPLADNQELHVPRAPVTQPQVKPDE